MSGIGATEDRVGPYHLVERIGEGGMGVVHRGVGPSGREVAIKVLRPAVADDATALRRLAREVDTMRRVRSAHVAEVIDADVTAERPYVVTQYVPGRSLEQVVQEDGPLRGRPLERLAAGLARALADIHAAEVVHRDLKPGNVMLVNDEPIVIDFGIAHAVDLTRLTATGLVIGTPGYLAPEIVEGAEAGPSSDVHSWASTVAFGATGRPPFGTGPFETIFFRIMQGKADLDGAPEALLPLLRSALSLNPAERPTAAKIADLAGRLDMDVTLPSGAEMPAPSQTRIFSNTDHMPEFAPAPPAPPRPQAPQRPEDFRGMLPPAPPPQPLETTRPGVPGHPPPYPGYGQDGPHPPDRPERSSRDYDSRQRADEPKPFGMYRILNVLLLAGLVGFAAVLPMVTFLVVVPALFLLRIGDRLARDLSDRRVSRGRGAGDIFSMVLRSPLATIGALLTTGLTVPIAMLIGFVVGVVALALGSDVARAGTYAMGTFVVVSCLGPGGGAPRRQLSRIWGAVLPRQQQALVAVGVVGLLVLFLMSFAFIAFPDWMPLDGNPFQPLTVVKQGIEKLTNIGQIISDLGDIGIS